MPEQSAPVIARVVSYDIRAPKDRNRVIGNYEPSRRRLTLYHRGERIVVDLGQLDLQCQSNDQTPSQEMG